MPTETFLHLPDIKRQKFIDAALDEFARHNYDAASINRIIRQLGIARGSVYQYFTDKLDLWIYLKEYAESVKLNHIRSVDRKSFPDFWTYYRELYKQGARFDLEHPHCSRFLYRLGYKETSAPVSGYLQNWKTSAREQFTLWVQAEKESGSIRRDIPTDIIAHFIMSVSSSITELLHDHYGIPFEENLHMEKPLLDKHVDEYFAAVSHLILLMEAALKPSI